MKRRAILLAALIVTLSASLAWARVGGGQSFGGGHGGGHGGSGSDTIDLIFAAFQLIYFLLWLCANYPYVGFPLIALIIVAFIILLIKNGRTSARMPSHKPRREPRVSERLTTRGATQKLRAEDPNFSEIILLDFVNLVYARYMEAKGAAGDPASLTPYVAPTLLEQLEKERQTAPVIEGVIVGSSQVARVSQIKDGWQIVVELETNYVERGAQDKKGVGWYARARMTFQRRAGAKSLGPEFTKSLNCPSCGSPVKVDQTGQCAYCGKVVKPGEFTWELVGLRESDKEPREKITLELGGVEVGTDLPTLYDPQLEAERKAFALAYASFGWDRFDARVKETFFAIQKAWTEQSWEAARPYETDRLFQTHLFWIERYRTQGCANKLEDIGIDRVDTAKIERDPYFDLITVRIFAHMIDYTVDAQGKVIDGNKKTSRKFSEYWTFIRKAGFTPKAAPEGAEPATGQCPSCGAPLKVSMSGVCEYCGANVSGGEFDWTLAKIEQDEVYTG